MFQTSRERRSWSRPAIVAVCVLAVVVPWPHPGIVHGCGLVPWEIANTMAAYLYALKLENSWGPANPRSRAELEPHLRYFATREIPPAESCWGRNYRLKPGERMLQYLILWHAPLDVVYDADDR